MEIAVYHSVPTRFQTERAALLAFYGLKDEPGITATALAIEDDRIEGCCSLRGNTMCQLAVAEDVQEAGLASQLLSALIREALSAGQTHLFLCTKPMYEKHFGSLGFYPIARTRDMLFMENRREGFRRFLDTLPKVSGKNGAIVCNCDPITLGHLHLITQAAEQCDHLYVFVLSEDTGFFPVDERYRLVKAATAHLSNVSVVHSSDYLISRSTFPAYFLKNEIDPAQARAELDLVIFGNSIAPSLGIVRRFVGEEPFCPVTAAYNVQMKQMLPGYGVEVIEIPRFAGISAGKVRALFRDGRLEELRPMVPEVTYDYLRSIASGSS